MKKEKKITNERGVVITMDAVGGRWRHRFRPSMTGAPGRVGRLRGRTIDLTCSYASSVVLETTSTTLNITFVGDRPTRLDCLNVCI